MNWADQQPLDPKAVQQLLRYEGKSGKLFWRPRPLEMFPDERSGKIWNTRFANKEAFTAINANGYRHGTIFGRFYSAHRIIWAVEAGEWPPDQIDHINNDRLDNRWENLRKATVKENMRNRVRSLTRSSSRFRGVFWSKANRNWVGAIYANGKRFNLGRFQCEVKAAEAYDAAAIQHFGEFANLNFPKVAA
jgi:hypothetical protein